MRRNAFRALPLLVVVVATAGLIRANVELFGLASDSNAPLGELNAAASPGTARVAPHTELQGYGSPLEHLRTPSTTRVPIALTSPSPPYPATTAGFGSSATIAVGMGMNFAGDKASSVGPTQTEGPSQAPEAPQTDPTRSPTQASDSEADEEPDESSEDETEDEDAEPSDSEQEDEREPDVPGRDSDGNLAPGTGQ